MRKRMGGLSMLNRRSFLKNLGAGFAGISLGAVPCDLFARDELVTLTIMHTNDMHCHIEPFSGGSERYEGKGGLARIAQLVKEQRQVNPHTLLFDAGDMFQGTPYFNYFKGELMLKTMTAVGYDLGTIGNHEFDNGLKGIYDPLPNAGFPLVNSNYDFSNTILAGKFPRYKIFKRDGIKVGVYGLGIEFDGLVSAKNYGDTVFNEPLKTALEMERFLKLEQECDWVVCLSHLGLRYKGKQVSDMLLAAETSMTDLILGGHTHSYLKEPMRLKNKQGQEVIVNQAWWGGLVVGKIDIVFGRDTGKKQAVFAEVLLT